ncbi:MAG TPA: arylsulfatase [Candidatus Limnocylindria bacterium]|jgi:arylsulfatase A-like enzyme|nr:arylsulfatase [Candidatus Limnocylindria bacterium]
MRRIVLAVAACLVAVSRLFAQLDGPRDNPGRTSKLPNILLILADDLGYGDLGCYGQTNFATPNIDRLAREGMKFTQAYAGNTVCAPSRCALMTGKHSGHGRVRSNVQVPLEPDDVTIAEVLRTVGYDSMAVGKWALGWEGTPGTPLKQGFNQWFGYLDQLHAHAYFPSHLWRNEMDMPMLSNKGGGRGDYAPDWFLRITTNYVKAKAESPFFIYYASNLPHANNELGTNGMLEIRSLGEFANRPWPKPEQGKAAMIARLDADVGVLLATLDRYRLDRQTLVIFASDNGPHSEGGVTNTFFQSSGPFRGQKRSLYEGGIRVPFIVRWPKYVKPSQTNDLTIALWDVLPTLAEVAGATRPQGLDGVSFAQSLYGREQKRKHDSLYWEFHEYGYQKAVRFGDWKALSLGTNKPVELYNLAQDPGETIDLAASHAEEVRRGVQLMDSSASPYVEPVDSTPKARF